MWRNWNSCTPLGGMQNGVATMENSTVCLKKLKIELSYNPAIPKELKSGSQ